MNLFENLHSDSCSICGQIEHEEGEGIQGMFGMMPVTFCQMCLNSMAEMIKDITEGEHE